MTVEELCKDQPTEFKEFMHYCKGLSFTQTPDYQYIIDLFENCMKNNNIDPKTPDFIWNKNRFVMEKEQMKAQMLKVLNKKPPVETKKTLTDK